MIDFLLLRKAIRARLLTLSVLTTGSTSFAATAAGYTRTAGSFITDGLAPGMELDVAGFTKAANNGKAVVIGVEAGTLHILDGRTAEASVSGRTISVALPSRRFWEGMNNSPETGYPYVEEDFQPGAPPLLRGMAIGGLVETLPMYVLRFYGVNEGEEGVAAIETYAHKILQLFPAGYGLPLSDGTIAHVRTDTMPGRTKVTPDGAGFSVCTLSLPFRTQSLNPAAA